MLRFAANISLMFTERPFLDRFAAAAASGFQAVEFLFPYDHPPEAIADRLAEAKLELAVFNLPPGDWAAGERGLAVYPDRREEFRRSVGVALSYAARLGAGRLHLMAGLAPAGDPAALESYLDALRFACDEAGPRGVDILIEPINGRDMPGYFLNDFARAAEIVEVLARPNLKLQFDVYHRQILHGDVVRGLEALIGIIGHVQIASVPNRNEPNSGELDDRFVLAALERLGYDGFVGCEYRPAGITEAGLSWLQPYRDAAPRSG